MPTSATSRSTSKLFPSGDSTVVSAVLAKQSSSRRHKVQSGLPVLLQVHLRCIIGRWPEKSVKFITRLLKNAESNADAKSLDLDNLVIKNIVVQQAPVCLPSVTLDPNLTFLDNRKLDAAHTALMVALTPTRVTLVTSKSSSRHLRKRWSEAKIRRLQRLLSQASTGDRLQGGVLRPHGLDFWRSRTCAGL